MTRLEEIEGRLKMLVYDPCSRVVKEDFEWLVSEVKRLRQFEEQPPTMKKPLPKAERLHIMTGGRSLYSIAGVPGLYLRKKPYDWNGEQVEADECCGKGYKPKWFYRDKDLELQLLAAMNQPCVPRQAVKQEGT